MCSKLDIVRERKVYKEGEKTSKWKIIERKEGKGSHKDQLQTQTKLDPAVNKGTMWERTTE